MAKHRSDEGSNSDSSSGSLKEITADDFKQQDAPRSRVWMGDHLMRYPPAVHRNYNQDLYSFAWAQAVQNKPLGFDVKPAEVDGDDDDEIEMYDVEKDLDLEEKGEEIGEFDKRFGVILEELETITGEEAESSFEEVCSRLQKCFASLKQMHSEGHGPVLDVLVQQAFMGIQTVYTVFNSGNLKNMDQNKELLLRLLIHIKNQYSVFLTPEHVKEIDVRVHALASEAVSVGKTSGNVNGSSNIAERPGTSTERLRLDPRGTMPVSGKASLSKIEVPTSRSRVDFSPLLNLHADYDEDSLPSPTRDNAPPLPMLKPIGFGMGVAPPAHPIASKNVKSENGTSHPYLTDPFQAVSSYQQKYGKNSTLVFNRLPSPTPSEDGNNGDDDIHGEVSSSSVPANARTVGPSSNTVYTNSSGHLQMAPVSSSVGFQMAPFNSSGGPQMSSVNSSGGFQMAPPNTSGGSQMAPVKTSAKSRDPRLRFMNSEVGGAPQNGFTAGSVNSRKNKAIDEPVPDEHNLKRQRNESTRSRDAQVTAGRGGWIEDNGMVASQMNNRVQPNKNMAIGNRNLGGGEVGPDRRLVNDNNNFNGLNGGSAPNMSTSPATVVSLPSLLKDIAVNPTMLVELLKMEQQKIAAAEAQQKAAGPAVNGLSSAVSPSPDVGQNPAAKPQMAPQTTNMNGPNDLGKIRMKPRDPRRVLHSNMVQKSESLGSEFAKSNGNLPSEVKSSKDLLTVQEQGEQAQTNTLPSQSASLPDISQQFTKNLQNLADIVSSSQTSALPVGTQNSSQPIPSKISNDTTEPKTVTGMCTQGETTSGVLESANPWGDVDHLLDGYDDQQKAAIQKERARRIEEQNKMFAERKLCLVLDLDHTLLNSAKFVEVDPIHEEILRQKEQEDRQKQERHLFRFPHMGMWTKLRPGVWNFLEKASKLYELHLYTMGNKLYATEMAKVLDPKGALFCGRVISKGDEGDPFDGDERVPKNKDLDGVLGMESAVVIIDDSLRVWPHNKHNLIVVERYMYFPSSRRQFGLPGPSLLEIDHDERPDAGTLASSLGVIERLHQIFFSHQSLNEVDVRNILAAEQRKILGGCKIVFSRVFPVGEANPHLHPLWQTAEQFGAECTNQIDEHVTHVVANSFGTDKVNWALSTGRFVVHPGWVEASALLYRRANEQDFAIKG